MAKDFRKFSEPAPNPNLALLQSSNRGEILVQYDALSEKHSKVKRHLYYLGPNQARIDAGEKPRFVERATTEGLSSIPVFETLAAQSPSEGLPYARVANQGRAFTLYSPPNEAHTYDLPVYPETSGTAVRVVLTPFAVAGDTVMVGCVAAVVAFVLWVQSGAPH